MNINRVFKINQKIRNKYYIFWNRLKFKVLGVALGKNATMRDSCPIIINGNGMISIGDNFLWSNGGGYNPLSVNHLGSICVEDNASVFIGDNVQMTGTVIWAYSCIKIGNNVKIGADAILLDTDAHSLDYVQRRDFRLDQANVRNRQIIIEDDVLIGTRTIILKGVHIGARSIIGAGSIVTNSIPPDCIAGGNPAKIIKYLDGEIP